MQTIRSSPSKRPILEATYRVSICAALWPGHTAPPGGRSSLHTQSYGCKTSAGPAVTCDRRAARPRARSGTRTPVSLPGLLSQTAWDVALHPASRVAITAARTCTACPPTSSQGGRVLPTSPTTSSDFCAISRGWRRPRSFPCPRIVVVGTPIRIHGRLPRAASSTAATAAGFATALHRSEAALGIEVHRKQDDDDREEEAAKETWARGMRGGDGMGRRGVVWNASKLREGGRGGETG